MRRTRPRVSRRSSCVPCERFQRKRSTPARTSPRSTGSSRLAGPRVAMILARRSMAGEYSGAVLRSRFLEREVSMFDGLQDKLQDVFRNLKGEGRVSPEALDAALRQIRMALLEADVHFRVVKPFIDRVRERALGQEVLESLTPAQQV